MRSRWLSVGVIVFTAIFAPAVLYVSPVFDHRPACERGTDWARLHAGELPKSASELAAFPVTIRRSVFSAMSSDAKVRVWREQTAMFARSKTLSETQRAIIRQFNDALVPAVYSLELTAERQAAQDAVNAVVKDAKGIFKGEDAHIFDRLGYGVAPVGSFASHRFQVSEFLRRHGSVAAGMIECNCTFDSDCPPSYICDFIAPCAEVYGCGNGAMIPCDQNCVTQPAGAAVRGPQ